MPHVIIMEEEKKTETRKTRYKKPDLLPACVIMLSITSTILFIMVILFLVYLKRTQCE